ncbi:uncharacterized protein [Pseudorca crassidens]|uniref:uncharacterized protein n=1 Tax=Pseudorca crassidens TaxID=82174 RepID=UPI00352CA9C9
MCNQCRQVSTRCAGPGCPSYGKSTSYLNVFHSVIRYARHVLQARLPGPQVADTMQSMDSHEKALPQACLGNPTPNHRPRPLPRRPAQLASCCSPRRREGSSLRAGAEQGGQHAPLSLGLALPRTPALLGVARGPTSRAHLVGEQIVAEAQASGRGRSRLNPGRAPREGRKSGRRLPAQLSGPRCPGGGHVTGGAAFSSNISCLTELDGWCSFCANAGSISVPPLLLPSIGPQAWDIFPRTGCLHRSPFHRVDDRLLVLQPGARAVPKVGEPSSEHWSTRDLPAPHNIKRRKSPRDVHLNTSTQLHSTTSKLQCWTPYAKQLARQKHNPTH